MRRGYGQPSHGRELEIPGRVQDVHFEGHGLEVELPAVEVLHGGPVLVAEAVEEEPLHDGAFPGAPAAESHQPDAVLFRHVGLCGLVGVGLVFLEMKKK